MASCSGPPYGARIVHHETDKLPVQQNAVSDEKATPPVQERTQQPQPLGGFFFTWSM